MYKLSQHITKDRINRMNYIIDTVGIGETIFTFPCEDKDRSYEITDTGVLLVVSNKYAFVVTMYILNIDKLYAIFATNHTKIPNSLYHTCIKNKKYLKNQPKD